MKTHIFVATTQGLVAIQNITPIDDPDISSVVSVNGTSTTANISSSYHNFVKKGVGIIHQMFGACSYRVDISARIDQGNSWQLAMYLAHLAQSKGLLGDGKVDKNDHVICATGEVNTSNQQILAVNRVADKFSLAEPLLKQWSKAGSKVQFLIPQENQTDIASNPYTFVVNKLEQAAAAVPQNLDKQPTPNVKSKKLVSINSQREILGAGLIIAVLLFFGLNQYMASERNLTQPLKNSDSQSPTLFAQPTHLKVLLKQANTCVQTTEKTLPMKNKSFAELAVDTLCEVHLKSDPSTLQVLLVAKDAYTVLPLKQSAKGWQIPLPKNRLSDRIYLLITLKKTMTENTIEQLRVYRETMSEPEMLTELVLAKWLDDQKVEFKVYKHKLIVQ
jgi:hypothetical protein